MRLTSMRQPFISIPLDISRSLIKDLVSIQLVEVGLMQPSFITTQQRRTTL